MYENDLPQVLPFVQSAVRGGRALVDYHRTGTNLRLSHYFNRSSGLHGRFDYGETPFYDFRGITVSYFREW